MSRTTKTERKKKAKYRRARIRNFLFTVGPSRLSGGTFSRRHLAKDLVAREVTTTSPNWPAAFDGLRIGHISDFHLGELITIDRALEAVALLESQEPDLVACTGDVVDLHHVGARPLLDAMAAIDAPLGSMLVLGNHDELHCAETLTRQASDAGMIVLEDDAVQVTRNGSALVVGGIGWANSAVACAQRIDRLQGQNVDLLLAHNPKAFLHATAMGIPLTLSGHTHGGQVAMKNRPNTSLAITHRHRAGLFEHGESRLFVTTGVGAWFPLRVNCPAEVAIITMRHGAPEDP